MFRRCRRPKTLGVSLVLLVLCVQILHMLLEMQREATPAASSGTFDTAFGSDFLKIAYGGINNRLGRSQQSIRMYGPFAPDFSDSVGLKDLQRYDCVRALEGFQQHQPLPSAPVKRLSDQDFIRLTKDCKQFRSKYGYQRYRTVTQEELNFPLAFNILLYKDVDQLHILLRAIYRPHNSYCLHVDGNASPDVYSAASGLANCLDNVFLVSQRENITYGGFSRLQADINCMKNHMHRTSSNPHYTNETSLHQQSTSPWRYLINLPSQQFPLKTNLELVKILQIYNGSNDIEGITGGRMMRSRFAFKHEYRRHPNTGRVEIVKTDTPHPPPPHNITVVKGSAYGVFSRQFVQFLLQDARARDLLEWCRSVSSPDEYYWATLHHDAKLNAPGGYSGPPDKKPWLAVYASWPPRDLCLSGKSVRGVCIFGVRDLPQLVSRKELFANKFYMDFQPEALHCLDQWIMNKSRAALPVETFYYRQLPFVRR
ncbi:hypothetical protein BaRGS_00010278 [Batillaria attramentaria]|uniref:Beta-1,3-galactosyl-O-glycosyl-glycoprotein beta-1,6-N-acetylglucosaminyltransferase n=1 Tax=Batillaria attramentaria TaxID=370345 RepID=A0ABD0LHN8_9CAEN